MDADATFSIVPSPVLERLGIEPIETVSFRIADNTIIERSIGDTLVGIEGKTFSTIVVFGDEEATPLLGVYALERALLAVDPVGQRFVPTEALMMQATAWPVIDPVLEWA